MRFGLGLIVGFCMASGGFGQSGTTASAPVRDVPTSKDMSSAVLMPVDTIVFDFQHAGLQPPHWGIEIYKNGHGRYYVAGVPTQSNPSGKDWREIRVQSKTMDTLLEGLPGVGNGKACETKSKNLAQTGKKKLSYVHSDLWSTCEFNYSDDKGVMDAAAAFEAIAETMQAGHRLEHDHRFDRLGLDAEMDFLVEQVKAGRAIEVQNIAATLKSIAEDERVMERVRRKAGRLLQDAGAAAQ